MLSAFCSSNESIYYKLSLGNMDWLYWTNDKDLYMCALYLKQILGTLQANGSIYYITW